MGQTAMQIGIIGAGVAGLSAAWDLTADGHQVDIFEAGEQVGGLAAGFRAEGWDWHLEKFYHHWFESDADLLRLLDEMGTRHKLLFPRPKTSYWVNGEIVRSEMNLSTLALPISWMAKFRLGLWGAYLKFVARDWRAMERVTAHEWMLSHFGAEAYDRFFRPLLIGKFGERYQAVNMAWLWARIVSRSLRLGMYQGGFQAFLNDLSAGVQQRGGRVHLNSPIERISQVDGKPSLTLKGEIHRFDRVLATSSPHLLLKLAPELAHTTYGQKVAALDSIGAVCVVLAVKQSVLTDGTYWLNLPATTPDKSETAFPFLALVEHTNFMDKAHYNGDTLIYCGDYVPVDHEYFQMSDAELVERFLPALQKVNPAFDKSWLKQSWVWRAPYAQPVPGINHSQRIPDLKTDMNGLYWASMSQVYPWDRGTNYAIEIGRRVAKAMST